MGVPPWAADPNVRNFLTSLGLELKVVADEKYLRGVEDRPLIVVRRVRAPNFSGNPELPC
jgi:hypothetical protein